MPDQTPGISIVITVKNEAANLQALFKSLDVQQEPFEVVLVDSESTDDTAGVVGSFQDRINIRHIVRKSTRGQGRNIGVDNSKYDNIVFIDGDVTVNPDFLKEYRKKFEGKFNLIAGEVVPEGVEKFKLDRVKLNYRGFEITRPSANLGYSRELFQSLKGFDPEFVTAEDIDLNLRAVKSGANFTTCEKCIVYNRTRENYRQFIHQAFWNGYGRRQLRKKNQSIWDTIDKEEKISSGSLLPNIVRLGFGALGYMYALLKT